MQINDITLTDGQSTPANVVFNVQSAQTNTPATWRASATGSSATEKHRMMLEVRRTSNSADKIKLSLYVPAVDADGIKTHQTLGVVEFVCPDGAVEQDRKDIAAYMASALQNSIILDAIVNGSPAY